MNAIMVNWVKEDEELLEPYEWYQEDDIEILSDIEIYHVDDKVLYDFIYGCIRLQESIYYNQIFIVSNTEYCIVVEIDSRGTLIYRSLTTFRERKYIQQVSKMKPVIPFIYTMYDEGMMKEYGLTRKERLRKQYIENTIDTLYVEDYERFLSVCKQLEIHGDRGIALYITMKQKIEKGYTFLHELLYSELSKNQ